LDSKNLINGVLKIVHKHRCIDPFCVMLYHETSPWVLRSVALVLIGDHGAGECQRLWLCSGGVVIPSAWGGSFPLGLGSVWG